MAAAPPPPPALPPAPAPAPAAASPPRSARRPVGADAGDGDAWVLELPCLAQRLGRLHADDLAALRCSGPAGRRAANAAVECMKISLRGEPDWTRAHRGKAPLLGSGAPFVALRTLRVAGLLPPPAFAALLASLSAAAPRLVTLDMSGMSLDADEGAACPATGRAATGAEALAAARASLASKAAARAAVAPLLAPLAGRLGKLKVDRAWLAAPAGAALADELEGGAVALSVAGALAPAALAALEPRLRRRLRKLAVARAGVGSYAAKAATRRRPPLRRRAWAAAAPPTRPTRPRSWPRCWAAARRWSALRASG